MVTKREAEHTLENLHSLRITKIGKASDALFFQPVDFGTKLHMSTVVYTGEKYIPPSVRKAASEPLDLKPMIPTWLSIEEELFEISLHYIGGVGEMDVEELYEISAIFEETAIRWRQIFEEKDRQDLIHVHQSR
jgi:hypothetical protein